MTRIEWDSVSERTYEAGLDRGVLYINDTGYAWNGLISVDDDVDDEDNIPVYIDNFKVRDIPKPGDFTASLKAFTYPDEFLACDGVRFVEGIWVDGQPPEQFSMSYRTLVGNDVEGVDFGYRIHIVYNMTAIADSRTYETMSLSSVPVEFGWNLTAIPQKAVGFRPTAHIIFDTRFLAPGVIDSLEHILYGSDSSKPTLPPIDFFIEWIYNYGLLTIINHGDGIWTALDNGEYISQIDDTTFQIDAPSVVMLDSVTYQVSTIPN